MTEATEFTLPPLLAQLQPDELRDLIDCFVADGSRRLEVLHRSARSSDLAALSFASHALKGSALAMGAIQLAEVCSEVEHSARLGIAADYQSRVTSIQARFAEASGFLLSSAGQYSTR